MQNELNLSNSVNTAAVSDRQLTQFFPGDSELATQMRALDWSQTPLGAVETWPPSLCTSVSICLQSRFPMLIFWGQEMVMLYNDAYRPMLGTSKHPYALGQRGRECWWEIWQEIGPMLDGVLTQGEATWCDDGLLLLDRNGYLEECYFTFSHSPILDETGNVGGIFTAVTETTKRVLGERRLGTLSELAAQTAGLITVTAACKASTAVLAKNPDDLPFVLLYSVDPITGQASLTVATGVTLGTEISPIEVNCAEADTDLSRCFRQVLETGKSQLFDLTDSAKRTLRERIDWSNQSLALIPTTAVTMLVTRSAQAGLAHICVVGVSPRRVFDRDYQDFCELVAGHLATAIATARSLEEGRKRTIALAEIDRAKTVFFSNVSHEFRTPLTLMLGPLEELSHSLTDRIQPAELAQLQLIQRNGIRLQKLVNTLLDFARIEAGRIQASYEPTDLATYTVELASMFRSLVERAGVELEIDCPPLSVPVYVDRQMWEKIVFNLISNAFKFTFSGTIAVRLQAVGDAVELSVRDTGVGIPTAELPRLFQRFYRVSGTRSRTYEGSGIGLAFVKRLVELHQGSIAVTSVEGAGTCFTITIPTGTAHLPPDRIGATRTLISTAIGANGFVEEAASWVSLDTTRIADLSPDLIVQSSILPVLDRQPDRTARILMADDNADLRDYLLRLLSPQYKVVAVADGVEALAAIRHQIPDLVLADIMMPNLDGLSLLRAIRSDPQTREIPIILLSARAGEEARLEGLAAGADDYITKPFSARELRVRVEVTLKLAQMRREATLREQALRLEAETAKAQFESILTSIRDGFYVLDRDWCFTYVNDRFCEMMAMSRAQLLGGNIWELFPPSVETEVYGHFHQAIRDRTPNQFENFYPAWQRWYEHRIYPSPSSLTIFVAEITERKLAEAKLHETMTLLNAIGDYSIDAIFAKDRAGRLLFGNPTMSNYFGKPVAELLGKDDFFVLQDNAAAAAIRANDLSIIASGVPAVFEESIVIGGNVRTFLSTKAPLRDVNGNVLGIVGIGHDITDRKLAEVALADRNQELDSFVHTVSHDLKAPLRAISNLSVWIEEDLEDRLPPASQQQFRLLRTRVKRMESMIDSLLLYARAGRQEARLETFDLAELLSEIIDSLAPPKGFKIDIQPPLPTLMTKRVFLSQVLTNLISNAIKHHTSVTGNLNISAIEHPDYHEFILKDDGPGIAPENHAKVFEIFQTLKVKENSDSTGIGLAIVKKIVEAEEGTIRLESGLGEGTTFYVTWPKSH
ncbi:ATP-binding protein [Chamaesiphon sp. OTE_20_metabat_361]|uniref:ATP-binding protein n=1 Tax=Chamaesiphon sp. OTE_20_metabat_361 TaxID=2964689 RepID=UPI00286AEA72|nr:ATP-binding protein [Chamaesiphon sp. OTE_20_metabat_361]